MKSSFNLPDGVHQNDIDPPDDRNEEREAYREDKRRELEMDERVNRELAVALQNQAVFDAAFTRITRP